MVSVGLIRKIDGRKYYLFREASTQSEVAAVKRLIRNQEGKDTKIRVLKNIRFSFRGKVEKSPYGVYYIR